MPFHEGKVQPQQWTQQANLQSFFFYTVTTFTARSDDMSRYTTHQLRPKVKRSCYKKMHISIPKCYLLVQCTFNKRILLSISLRVLSKLVAYLFPRSYPVSDPQSETSGAISYQCAVNPHHFCSTSDANSTHSEADMRLRRSFG